MGVGRCEIGGVDVVAGDVLTIDGSTGHVYLGAVGSTSEVVPEVAVIQEWVGATRPTSSRSSRPVDRDRLLVIVALLGASSQARLADAAEACAEDIACTLELLSTNGLITTGGRGLVRLTDDGFAEADLAIDRHRRAVGLDDAQPVLEGFAPLDLQLKQAVTDWQIRATSPNDHTDATHDAQVLRRLRDLGHRLPRACSPRSATES